VIKFYPGLRHSFGIKSKERTIARGTFLCPSCKTEQPYHHMAIQEYGHLFFISLVPMGDVLEVVECQTCFSVYPSVVLAPPLGPAYTQEAFDDFYGTLLNVMILTMLVDGQIEEAERDAVRHLFEKIVGIELAQTYLDAEISRAVARGPDGLILDIAAQRNTLDQEKRIMFLRAAVLVAYADSAIEEQEMRTLKTIAKALGITDEELRTTVELFLSNKEKLGTAMNQR